MALAPWSTVYPDVTPFAMGCPYPVIDNAIRNAVIEFCDFSLAYQVDLPVIVTADDTPTYAMSYDANTNVADVVTVRTDSRRLTPMLTANRSAGGELWEVRKGGEPLEYFLTDPNTLRLLPIPDGAYNVYVKAALKVLRSATGVEAWLLEQYRDVIVAGTLSQVLRMNGPWKDPNEAQARKSEFEAGKGQGRIDALKNFTRASVIVQPRAFGK